MNDPMNRCCSCYKCFGLLVLTDYLILAQALLMVRLPANWLNALAIALDWSGMFG
jgi:hypothetical protein